MATKESEASERIVVQSL